MSGVNSNDSTERQSQATLAEIAEDLQEKRDEESSITNQTEDDTVDDGDRERDGKYPETVTIEISTKPWLERFGVDIEELDSPSLGDGSGSTELGPVSESEMLPESIKNLPRRLPESERPDPPTGLKSSRPTACDHCGSEHDVWKKPLEKGSIEDPSPEPCDLDEVDSCDCCGCPECGAKSIYYRETKTPDYRCQSPECGYEFSRSEINLLNKGDDEWEFLLWECRYCGEPTLAPFDGIPREYILAAMDQQS